MNFWHTPSYQPWRWLAPAQQRSLWQGLRVLSLLALLALGLAGCTNTITLGASDTGKTIQVRQGDEIALQLNAIPDTGYAWVITHNDSTRLALQSDTFKADNPQAIGSGGVETFTFKAMAPGTVALALEQKGPQVTNPKILGTFAATIQITGS